MTRPWDRPHHSPSDIAREMIQEIGRGAAIRYMLRRLVKVRSWREAGQGVRLLVAVVRG